MEIDRNGLEVLDRRECLELLAGATFGRVAITVGALPIVLPVNFCLVGDRILFRTAAGSKLEAATCGHVVAFEVDSMDPVYHSGWSVMATGRAREVTDPAELASLGSAKLSRWAPRGEGRVVEISTELLSGRRLVPGILATV